MSVIWPLCLDGVFLLFHIVSCPFATNCRLIEKDDLWFDQ